MTVSNTKPCSDSFGPAHPASRIEPGKNPLRVLLTDIATNTIKFGGRTGSSITPKEEWEGYVQLRELVDDLLRLQKDKEYSPSVSHGPKDFTKFKQWLSEQGVSFEHLDFKDFGDSGNGVFATRKVEKGETLVQIPTKLMLTTETAIQSPALADLSMDPILRAIPSTLLALHLLMESLDPTSFWNPYISLLPKSFNTPLFYSVDECEELKGSHVMWETVRYFRSIARQYVHIQGLLERQRENAAIPVSKFTYAAFRWAISIVMTRQNRVPVKSNRKAAAMALIPVWDFCNHEELAEITTFYDPNLEVLECQAGRTFEEDEQVTIYYGERPNADLLLYSGFVDPNAWIRDRVKIAIGMGKNEGTDRRKQLCDAYEIPSSGTLDLHHPPLLTNSRSVMLAVRVITCPDAELDLALAATRRLGNNDPLMGWGSGVVSTAERKALGWLKVRCGLMMRGYKGSWEEDEKMLEENAEVNCRMRSIAILRLGERKLLKAVCKAIDDRLAL